MPLGNSILSRSIRCGGGLLWAWLLTHSGSGAAWTPPQELDVVVVRTSDPEVTAKRRGRILDWLGPELTLEIGGSPRAISNEEIVELQVTWPADYQAAQAQLANRQFAEAVPLLSRAIATESRGWAARLIRRDLIRCLSVLGQDAEAIQHFLILLDQDPETRMMDIAPLAWDSGLAEARVVDLARQAVKSKGAYPRLLGASWLLGSSDRAAATAVLQELSQDIRPVVAHLATAQLWRSELLTARQTEVDRWARQVERMPRAIQAGPLYVLGLAEERLGKSDDALMAWLRIPILHAEQERLSAVALVRAAGILEARGQVPEARRVWSELASQFPATSWGTAARARLNQSPAP